MRILFRILLAMIIAGFLPALSFADWNGNNNGGHGNGSGGNSNQGNGYKNSGGNGNQGNWHGNSGHHHDHSYVGLNLAVYPSSYYDDTPVYYPPDDAGVLIASPAVTPVVVTAPPVTVVEPPEGVSGLPAVEPVDSITINIPNDHGTFTAVTLKRSGNGFIGPQGEFYSEFPSVAQLRVIYGK